MNVLSLDLTERQKELFEKYRDHSSSRRLHPLNEGL